MSIRKYLKYIFIFNFLASFGYYFWEWLFFVTKSSALLSATISSQLVILLISPLILLALSLGASVLILVPSKLFSRPNAKSISISLVPSIIIASGAYLLIENFSNTILGFHSGVILSNLKFTYLAGMLYFIFYFNKKLQVVLNHEVFEKFSAKICTFFLLVTCLSVTITIAKYLTSTPIQVGEMPVSTEIERPNILILATDGLRAQNMSTYGAKRKTTPFIDTLAKESLVFENHYTNSAKTTGSVISMLTGKYPATTRVIFRPDILKEQDIFEHLPGILKRNGYYSRDFSVRHYVDAYDINMREGFDIANGRSLDKKNKFQLPRKHQSSFGLTAIFLQETYGRITNRLLHISGLKEYSDAFTEVAFPKHKDAMQDENRVKNLKEFIKNAPEPFFGSVHLLNTHGGKFKFRKQHFSSGEQTIMWDDNFYDDSILTFDSYVKEVVNILKKEGRLERTILVINSDHGKQWGMREPLPLIIRFPGAKRRGRVHEYSQRLDIAPTILDYMGLPTPGWMEGVSLMSAKGKQKRDIFAVSRTDSKRINGWSQVANPKPPFYTLGSVALINCNQWFEINFEKNELEYIELSSKTEHCPDHKSITRDQAKAKLLKHLTDRAYDVSSISELKINM